VQQIGVRGLRGDRPLGSENACGRGQVEAFFADVGRCQVDGDAVIRKLVAGVFSAALTRSLLFLTVVSGGPTVVKAGSPGAKSTSTSMMSASIPNRPHFLP
jgi:hypothetical protein